MPAPVTLLGSSTVRGIELRELVYRERVIPRHTHVTAGFCLVLDGAYEERYAARTLACRARTVTFSPAGEEHSNVFAADSHCLTVELPANFFARLDSGASRFREPFETQGGALAFLGERLLREMRGDDDAATLIVEGLVLEMTGEAVRHDSVKRGGAVSPALRRAHELLHAHFREPLSLADIATATARHPVYLASAFRQAYGETIGECIRRLRVEHASRALEQSATPIAEVAVSAGFANQSHFTRAFKRATGLTPGAYRRRHAR